MQILIATPHLKLNGIGTYVYSLTKELVRRGHEVKCVTQERGRLGTIGQKLTKNLVTLDSIYQQRYDLILVFTNSLCREIINRETEGYLIFMVQGLYFNNDIPSRKFLNRINRVLTLSESSRDAIMYPKQYDFRSRFVTDIKSSLSPLVKYNAGKYFGIYGYSIDSKVVPNPIDTYRYRVVNSLRDIPKVLILCKSRFAADIVKNSCDELEYESEWQSSPDYDSTSLDKHFCFEMEEKITNFDLVVGIGRPIIEAMSCGRNVIVFDKRFYYKVYPADGFIDMNNINDASRFNFCGKDKTSEYKEEHMIEELKKYDKSLSFKLREFVMDNHSIQSSVDKIIGVM